MNHTFRTGLSLLGAAVLAAPAAHAQWINEIFWNPPGTDAPNEFVEIRGTPNASLSGVYLIFLEGDAGPGPGDVQNIFDLTSQSLGTNGFLTIRQFGSPYSLNASASNLLSLTTGFGASVGHSADSGTDIENLSFTAMLINIGTGSAPTLSLDLDTEDNGLDALPAGWSILDSIAFLDGGMDDRGYGSLVFSRNATGNYDSGATFVNQGWTEAEYAMRLGDSTENTVADWVVADIVAGVSPLYNVDGADVSNNAFNSYLGLVGSHIGSPNPVPEPSSAPLLGLAGLLAGVRRPRVVI